MLPDAFDQTAQQDRRGRAAVACACRKSIGGRDGGEYPAIAHELAAGIGDAILRAACAFLDDGKAKAPSHYRALGRSAYLAAALKADRKLDRIARSFDFLLSISPIDTAKAFDRFVAEGEGKPPHFHYRPLTVDPDVAKRELYAIDLRALEDPLLERLLGEKRHEIDAQLTMLATRNTPAFRPASMFLYGAIESRLLNDARTILARPERSSRRADRPWALARNRGRRGAAATATGRSTRPSRRHPGPRRCRRPDGVGKKAVDRDGHGDARPIGSRRCSRMRSASTC